MKIIFLLTWLSPSSKSQKPFKMSAYNEAFAFYKKRIAAYASIEENHAPSRKWKKCARAKVLFCDTSKTAIDYSSLAIAEFITDFQQRGISEVIIGVGGANGYSKEILQDYQPDYRWRFGNITLPHELAAVVACEQIYRGFTILHKQPYHLGH